MFIEGMNEMQDLIVRLQTAGDILSQLMVRL
jgi:hypothetical protein